MKRYFVLLVVGIILALVAGIFWTQKDSLIKGELPSINISSEIPGFEILPSDSYQKTAGDWVYKLGVDDYKRNYSIKFLPSDSVKLDYSTDGVTLANTYNILYQDGKSVLTAIGLPKKGKTSSFTEVTIYISKDYLFDKSFEILEKTKLVNGLIFRGILINSLDRSGNQSLFTEKELKNLNELWQSKSFPFEIKIGESGISRGEQRLFKLISKIFSFEIVEKVYAEGCCELGSWQTNYYCSIGGASCTPGVTNCFPGTCVEGSTTCVKTQSWSNVCAEDSGVACCYGGCTCSGATPPPTVTPPPGCVPTDIICGTQTCNSCTEECRSCGCKPIGESCPPSCTPSTPGLPSNLSPNNVYTQIYKDVATSLTWTGNGWGKGCPSNTNNYQVCPGTGCTVPINTGEIASYSWTPTVAGVTPWKVRASNGTVTTGYATGQVCVEGGPYLTAWPAWPASPPACGTVTRSITCTENCEFDNCPAYLKANYSAPQYTISGNTVTETMCFECVTCGYPYCGQLKDCGGSCSSQDDGVPTIPSCGVPTGQNVTAMPTTIYWTSGGTLAESYEYSINGAAAVNVGNTLSASVTVNAGANNFRARSVNTTCGTDRSSWSSLCNFCYETGPTYGTCDSNHKRTVSYDCQADTTEDCIGTITGTLFDASEVGDTCSVAEIAASPKLDNKAFSINGNPWAIISANAPTVTTNAGGVYSQQVYASTRPANYLFDYSDLINSGQVAGVKTQCGMSMATLTTQGQTVTKNTGFWRVYGGWWQAVGGSVYAETGLRSRIPASVPPLSYPFPNQKLLVSDGARTGILIHGYNWQGTELGTNPNADVSETTLQVKSVYDGLRYDYNFFKTRMDVFPSSTWTNKSIENYDDGGVGYMIFKSNTDVTIGEALNVNADKKAILLVDGDVSINANILVTSGSFFAIIASGTITYSPGVTSAQGWYVADSIYVPCAITAGACNKTDVQFEGQGSFVGWSGINLYRDMAAENNNNPSEKFIYRPDFLLNAPTPIRVYSKKYSPFIP